ncbi:hypothetical protein OSK91_11225, partial [Escherichia coli]|nr:hypothetical protein [Escherichia coli]
MSTETIEIFNNSDEWANQLKHALSKGENLALLHGLTPDILGNDSNLLIVFYVQIMPDDFVMQLHR